MLVPVSVLLLHDVGFWPVAVLAALPVPGALFAIGAGRRPSARGAPGDPSARTREARRAPGSAAAAALRRALAPAAVLCALTIAGGAIVTILPISRSGFVATAGLAVVRGDGRGGPVAGGRAGASPRRRRAAARARA